jgi:hypothetical protein
MRLPEIRDAMVGARSRWAYPQMPRAECLLRFSTREDVKELLSRIVSVAGREHPEAKAITEVLEERSLWDQHRAAALLGYGEIESFNDSCHREKCAELRIARFIQERRDEFNLWLVSRGFHPLQGTETWLRERDSVCGWFNAALAAVAECRTRRLASHE